ncbi:hypothetical protein [Aquipuribacter nitratireducens]|uniref:Sodium:proton antiporter n=1 Tax=Aquipuribacter nitratireducens TaxID=650104 RepID=A0ABW0GTY9_9MICO
MTVVLLLCASMLVVSAALCLVRLVRARHHVERLTAFDVLTAVLVMGLALLAVSRDEGPSIVLVVVALVGFLTGAAVVRLVPRSRR